MYATCLFCNKPLGANEVLEAFPVGERLAFDAARGRLWVVCRNCERWNLSPLDERWEAIEQAEKLYRDSRRRVSTDNVGLAKVRDGTTLIRIGEPLRPEFAAWRYGDQFGRRRRRAMLVAGGGIAALGAVLAGGTAVGAGFVGFAYMLSQIGRTIVHGRAETVVARIRTDSAGLVHVRRRHLAETSLATADDGSLAIDLRFKNGRHRFTGREAERIASIVVPKVNRFGGSKAEVASAVREIESLGSRRDSSHTSAESLTSTRDRSIRWAFRAGGVVDGSRSSTSGVSSPYPHHTASPSRCRCTKSLSVARSKVRRRSWSGRGKWPRRSRRLPTTSSYPNPLTPPCES